MSNKNQIITQYVKNAVSEVLRDFKVDSLDHDKKQTRSWLKDWPDEVYTCVMGFHSDSVNGSLVICCEEEILRSTCPTKHLPDYNSRQTAFRDWLGEMGNLIMGRMKAAMLAHKVTLQLNPPSVTFSSPTILDSYAERNPSGPVWFLVDDEKLCIQFGADTKSVDFDHVVESGDLGPGQAVIGMNPLSKSRIPPQTNPSKKSEISPSQQQFGVDSIQGIALEQGKVIIAFSQGFQLRMNTREIKSQATQIQLGTTLLGLEQQDNGISLQLEGIEFFVPFTDVRMAG